MGRVVVGVDGSAESRDALRYAVGQAEQGGHEVVAVHAYPLLMMTHPYAYWGEAYLPADDLEDRRERAAEELRRILKETVGDTDVPIREEVIAGPAAQVLLDASEGADLLVIGTRGLGGFRALMLGSVSLKVATHATCPVVVMPASDAAEEVAAGQ